MNQVRRPASVRFLILAATAALVGASVPAASDDTLVQVRVRRSRDAFVVARAIQGAARRLEGPGCRGMLSDLRTPEGLTLADVLAAEGETGPGHLRRLLFYSGDEHPHCRKDVLAWTTPGSRVVYVCAERFREAYATKPAHVEAVIVHEVLHTLGLGENPPSSAEITARVVAACGP
jgi:hypothetical protein